VTTTTAPGREAVTFYRTSVGKKVVMAASGVVMYGFLLAHMVGNLKIFLGPTHFDEYSAFLRRIGEPLLGYAWLLWALRSALIVAVVLHIWSAAQLMIQSKRARPVGYHDKEIVVNYASRTMRIGGVIILAFIVFHLLNLTFGTVHPGGKFEHGAVYHNTATTLSVWWVAAFYLLAMGALAFHLFHGMWSIFQTFGINSPQRDKYARAFATGSTVLIAGGFIAVPIAALAGVFS
jgi:succinate dehydrogenase / fumarate reductase cytochrome b subunit